MRRLVFLAAVVPLSICFSAAGATESKTGVDHSQFARVLDRVVRGGRVDYLALRDDHADLDTYVRALAGANAADLDSDNDRLAFWLNAYNALVLKSVVDNWPVASVRDVPGFFTARSHVVAGQRLSLHEIMNDKLRGRFSDPRVVFATVWGCVGCAPLQPEPYSGQHVDSQLDKTVTAIVHDERYVRIDMSGAVVYLPEFVKWYDADFRRVYGGPVEFVQRYYPEKFSGYEREPGSFAVSYMRFDWNINIARLPGR